MNVWLVQIVGLFDPLLWANNHPIGFSQIKQFKQIVQKFGILGKKLLLPENFFLNQNTRLLHKQNVNKIFSVDSIVTQSMQ